MVKLPRHSRSPESIRLSSPGAHASRSTSPPKHQPGDYPGGRISAAIPRPPPTSPLGIPPPSPLGWTRSRSSLGHGRPLTSFRHTMAVCAAALGVHHHCGLRPDFVLHGTGVSDGGQPTSDFPPLASPHVLALAVAPISLFSNETGRVPLQSEPVWNDLSTGVVPPGARRPSSYFRLPVYVSSPGRKRCPRRP